jgi:hypothetical protein
MLRRLQEAGVIHQNALLPPNYYPANFLLITIASSAAICTCTDVKKGISYLDHVTCYEN